jgi:protoporphyrinogen oxidase
MQNRNKRIVIIGAGISGLVAAKVLEENGFSAVIYEKMDRAGGRLKTDIVEGFQMDQGFQVLLDAYPMAKKHLDFSKLKLQKFIPGAVIYNKSNKYTLGDPIRNISLLRSTLTSNIGNLSDKFKIVRLSIALRRKSIDQIFEETETTTKAFLETYGFSEGIINLFFKPFFAGIFLEPFLETSSRMFQFVFKMFGEGSATLPIGGIAAIPEQLLNSLSATKIQYNVSVKDLTENKLTLDNGTEIDFDYAIIATEPRFKNSYTNLLNWKRCDTLYFTSSNRDISKPLIGLIADEDALINNIFYHTSLGMDVTTEEELLSVTVVKQHNLSNAELVEKVQQDLNTYCGINNLHFLKHYAISKALPDKKNIKHKTTNQEIKLNNNTFLAGDYLLNGSLNAAMASGEHAALALISTMKI